MSGSFRIAQAPTGGEVVGDFHHERSRDAAHDHVVLSLSSGATVTYNDPRRFGFMLMTPRASLADHPLMAKLGVEPTGNDLSASIWPSPSAARPPRSRRRSSTSPSSPASAISMSARRFTGPGCHRSGGGNPGLTKGGDPTVRLERLVPVIREVIAEAIAAGGSSLRDHAQPSGELGYFQHSFHVYDREGEACRRCGDAHTVRRIVQSGRSTFYCAACQR